MIRAILLALTLTAPMAAAQSFGLVESDPLDPESKLDFDSGRGTLRDRTLEDVTRSRIDRVTPGTGALLRGLDKVSGDVTDIDLAVDEGTVLGGLEIRLGACRYPQDNPAGDAYAWLDISTDRGTSAFSGWMVASSPALMALDHPRYDVWVIRCKTT